jgi:PAS domain S-box-containing protein
VIDSKEGEGANVAQYEDDGYRELFEASPQAMWVCHRETGRFLAVNRAALGVYGYGREEFLRRSLGQLAPDHPRVQADGVSLGSHVRKDGTTVEVELSWQPVAFQGEPAQLVLVHEQGRGGAERETALEREVAERGAQLQAAQRELETFCYSVSHDLRAPLRHIDGFSRAVLDDHSETLDHQAREYLARIGQAAGKMSQLLDAMGLLARVARTELDRQTVNLSIMAQIIFLELKHRNQERQVEFKVEDGVSVVADPRLIRQLMEILIGNAWKFTSKLAEAEIEFGTVEQDGEKAYFVKDNGAGFDMEYAEKLFSIFHRQHRADEFEGSGVGLAIAQRIVGRHGGRIWAESAPGQGATFYFKI